MADGSPVPKKPLARNTSRLGESFIYPPHVIDDIHIKAELGRYRMRGFSLFKKIPHWDDLTFLPGTLTRFVIEGYREKCTTDVVFASGVHGVLLAHARSPEVVKVLVQAARYPHAPEAEGIGEGLRGSGGQGFAARIWGVTQQEYQRLADPWPLNPDGELLIGLKIEDRHALDNAEASTAVPGVGFAEWGPGDMRMSFDVGRTGTPQDLVDARARVLAATQRAGIPFLNQVNAGNIEEMIDEGVRIGANPGAEVADQGRRYTSRQMPW